MKAAANLPSTKTELENMDFDSKCTLWARYSTAQYRRQIRALWHHIQCERQNIGIEKKYITMFRKYMQNPDACLTRVYKSKYILVPGAQITKIFRGVEFVITVGDHGEFIYNNKSFKSLSAVAKEICGAKVSGYDFFGLNNKRFNNGKD